MGCCVSSGKSFNPAQKFTRNSAADNGGRESPSSMEEETVKEVLSETPALKPPLPPPSKKNCPPEEDEAPKSVGDEIEKKLREIPIKGIAEQASEFYEISNPNKCLSDSAATFDKMDGGGEVHQKVLKSSPVKLPKNQSITMDVELKREITPNRTLNRRSNQSPVRRNGAVGSTKLVQNRDVSPAMARRGLRAEPPQKDPDENFRLRSRSPATARSDGGGSRSALGRTPSVRKVGKSPPILATTATAIAPAGSQKVVEENNIIDGKFNTQIESLENPLKRDVKIKKQGGRSPENSLKGGGGSLEIEAQWIGPNNKEREAGRKTKSAAQATVWSHDIMGELGCKNVKSH